jgi:hypothetical protein
MRLLPGPNCTTGTLSAGCTPRRPIQIPDKLHASMPHRQLQPRDRPPYLDTGKQACPARLEFELHALEYLPGVALGQELRRRQVHVR